MPGYDAWKTLTPEDDAARAVRYAPHFNCSDCGRTYSIEHMTRASACGWAVCRDCVIAECEGG
jgi:transposase-like protein